MCCSPWGGKELDTTVWLDWLKSELQRGITLHQPERPSSKSVQTINAGEVEKRNRLTLLVGLKIGTVTMENSMEVPYKTKQRATVWPSNLTAGHILWEDHNSKRYLYASVHGSSTIYNSQDTKATQMSTAIGMDKEDVLHLQNEILLSQEKLKSVEVMRMNRSYRLK